MKARFKNYITTILGSLLLIFSTLILMLGYFEEEIDYKYIIITGGIGLLLLFAKDSLIEWLKKKLSSK